MRISEILFSDSGATTFTDSHVPFPVSNISKSVSTEHEEIFVIFCVMLSAQNVNETSNQVHDNGKNVLQLKPKPPQFSQNNFYAAAGCRERCLLSFPMLINISPAIKMQIFHF